MAKANAAGKKSMAMVSICWAAVVSLGMVEQNRLGSQVPRPEPPRASTMTAAGLPPSTARIDSVAARATLITRKKRVATWLLDDRPMELTVPKRGDLLITVYPVLTAPQPTIRAVLRLAARIEGTIDAIFSIDRPQRPRWKVEQEPSWIVCATERLRLPVPTGSRRVSLELQKGGPALVEISFLPRGAKKALPVTSAAANTTPLPRSTSAEATLPPPNPNPAPSPEVVGPAAPPASGPEPNAPAQPTMRQRDWEVTGDYPMVTIERTDLDRAEALAHVAPNQPFSFVAHGPGVARVTVFFCTASPGDAAVPNEPVVLTITEDDVLLHSTKVTPLFSPRWRLAGHPDQSVSEPEEYRLILGPRTSRFTFFGQGAQLAISLQFEPQDRAAALALSMDLGDGATTEPAPETTVAIVRATEPPAITTDGAAVLAIAAKGGYATNLGTLSWPVFAAEIQWGLPVLQRRLSSTLGIGLRMDTAQRKLRGFDEKLEITLWAVPLLVQIGYDQPLAADWTVSAGLGGGAYLVGAYVRSASIQPDESTGFCPALSATAGVKWQIGPGRLVLEVFYHYVPIDAGSVRGNLGGLGGVVGYGLPVW